MKTRIITTDTGYFKPGLKGEIVDCNGRTVYLGKDCVQTEMAEFTVKLDSGFVRPYCQLQRDFVFAESR